MPSEIGLVAIALSGQPAADAIRQVWDLGEAVFPVHMDASPDARSAAVARVRATAIIDGSGRRSLAGLPVATGCAAVVETSGTGAAPRPVALPRSGMEAMAGAYSAAIDAGPGDRWLAALPLSGVAGLAMLARSYVTGVPITVHPAFAADAVAAAAGSNGSIVSLVPTALGRLLDAGAPLDRFRVVLVGGGPVPAALLERAQRHGVRVVTTYGMTETWGGFALDGVPIRGARVRIGTGDEIEVAGPMVMTGYHHDPAATASAFTGDGWFRTGDAGRWDGHRVRVTDRLRDLVISGGVNVSPTAVEAALVELDTIADVCVAGCADPEWGEAVTAFVVPADAARPPTLAELRAAAKGHLPDAWAPRRVELVDVIPRNAAGKPLRRKLVEAIDR
jgi:O-succinylbenzoic acid--CoA ligase